MCCGVVWCAVMWCGVVCRAVVWYGVLCCGTAQHSTAHHTTPNHTISFNGHTIPHHTTPHQSTPHYTTPHHTMPQYHHRSTVIPGRTSVDSYIAFVPTYLVDSMLFVGLAAWMCHLFDAMMGSRLTDWQGAQGVNSLSEIILKKKQKKRMVFQK